MGESACQMEPLYRQDLAYIQAAGFGKLAEGAASEIIRVLKSAPTVVRSVLDLGCGAGPLTAKLVEAGFETTGVDASEELLKIARIAVPEAQFVCGSIYDIAMPAANAILAIGEPLTYHAEDAEADVLVGNFFRQASDVLPSGGMLIFDVITHGEPSLNGRYWSSGEDWAVMAETKEDQSSRTLTRKIETFRRVGDLYRRDAETHHVRLFSDSALLRQLAACGFEVKTSSAYGAQQLPPRRRAFFCTREADSR